MCHILSPEHQISIVSILYLSEALVIRGASASSYSKPPPSHCSHLDFPNSDFQTWFLCPENKKHQVPTFCFDFQIFLLVSNPGSKHFKSTDLFENHYYPCEQMKGTLSTHQVLGVQVESKYHPVLFLCPSAIFSCTAWSLSLPLRDP